MRILKRSLLILVILIYSGLAQAQKPLIPETLIDKFAQVLVGYSLDLQPGEKFLLITNPQAEELNLAVYKHAIIAGAHVFIKNYLAG